MINIISGAHIQAKKSILFASGVPNSPQLSASGQMTRTCRHSGKKHIPKLLSVEMSDGYVFKQVALFVFASNKNVKLIGGGQVKSVNEFMREIKAELSTKKVAPPTRNCFRPYISDSLPTIGTTEVLVSK